MKRGREHECQKRVALRALSLGAVIDWRGVLCELVGIMGPLFWIAVGIVCAAVIWFIEGVSENSRTQD